MDERLQPVSSSLSILSDNLNQPHSPDQYELQDVSHQSRTTAPAQQEDVNTERQHLVEDHTYVVRGDRNINTRNQSIWTKLTDFFKHHNPFSRDGQRQIKTVVLRSGPVTRISKDPFLDPSPSFRKRWRLYGWRFGVFVSTIAIGICLLVEIVMLICAVSLNKPQGNKHGIGILYEGSCSEVKRLTNILAVPLNVIATVLVATSNYVMQCLCAPTRKDIDKAHASGKYLDIGIPSIHNLIRNFSRKSVLWLVLVFSTIPIHLLLNSAFFGALQANNYGVLVATTDWKNISILHPRVDSRFNNSFGIPLVSMFLEEFVRNLMESDNSSDFQQLSKGECFEKYSEQLQTTASNVLVVTMQNSGKYSTIPNLNTEILDTPFGYANLLDSMHTFQMRDGIGLYFEPSTGNAMPILNDSYHWTHAVLPQNISGGLYLLDGSQPFQQPELRSVFSALDYHYWMTIKQLQYDFNNPAIVRANQFRSSSWLCDTTEIPNGQSCTSGNHRAAPDPWQITPEGFTVDHCISQRTPEKCSLQYSFIILVVVIGCDVVKILAMSATLMLAAEEPLATLGDAVASFLEQPDTTTKDCCLVGQKLALQICQQTSRSLRFRSKANTAIYLQANKSFAQRLGNSALTHKRKIIRWLSIPSIIHWLWFFLLYMALLGTSIAVLGLGIRNLQQMGIDDPFQQGFGSINPNAIFAYRNVFQVLRGPNTATSIERSADIQQMNKEQSLFSAVVTVNSSQLLFSMLYFMYNAIFTSMVAASEWANFATVRKALRVSQPRVGQRSSYWLQLPWKFSFPLLSMSIFLHWLVSRSLFVVRIRVFRWDGIELPDRNITACGYSPLAILIVILIVVLSLIVILGFGYRKLHPDMPVCGTNSVAISAACHYDQDGDGIVTDKPLRWGVTESADDRSLGHCSMSDKVVGLPVEGMRYM